MKFSIVVPVYNVEQYLEQCLESLQAQNDGDYEVICVNDGSTDSSRDILAEWEARMPQMRVIDRENGGLSAARNTGLKATKGDYVLFVDSDDWVEHNFLECLNSSLITHHSSLTPLDMICFACQRTDNEATDSLHREQTSGWDYYNRHALEARVVPFVCVWQRCYRREFLMDNNLCFREGILHEDNEFTPRVCLKAKSIKVIPDVLYNYRVRPNSIMTTIQAEREEYSHASPRRRGAGVATTRGIRSKESLILIGNELSELFSHESGIDKTIIYRALTQYYQMAFIDNTQEEDRLLHAQIDWKAYRRVSRTKLRHRINYAALRLSPSLFRLTDI